MPILRTRMGTAGWCAMVISPRAKCRRGSARLRCAGRGFVTVTPMPASGERTYIVTYDISDTRGWRRVFKTMNGFGEWLQLSVFQCQLSRRGI